ncbi:hypothetical protein PK98_14790 [Croceibacterium mercuriale]|uniref:Uncharacterized protein n=1 Tax=Croceibacterium mercuriale TaxID=1572751 RepID=A0A0B2BWB8_9SPHN|nr:hypothetical protein PK98_14790 [Croceibacterium mercuriale]
MTEYREESGDVTRVVYIGTDLSDSTFRVSTKAGMTQIFDGLRNSRVAISDGTVLMLLQSSAEDTAGNYFDFFIASGQTVTTRLKKFNILAIGRRMA